MRGDLAGALTLSAQRKNPTEMLISIGFLVSDLVAGVCNVFHRNIINSLISFRIDEFESTKQLSA